MPRQVSWQRPVQLHLNQVSDNFKSDLKTVAGGMALHERMDSVQTKHVDDAFAALSRNGLCCKPVWRRPQTWAAFGGALIGLSFSASDVIGPAADYLNFPLLKNFIFPTMIVVLVIGVGISIQVHFACSLPVAKAKHQSFESRTASRRQRKPVIPKEDEVTPATITDSTDSSLE